MDTEHRTHPSGPILDEADRISPPSSTGTTTPYPAPSGAESSPPADFPAPLLARLDHVRAWLRDHPETARHVSSVDVACHAGTTVYMTGPAGHAPLLALGAPTRVDRYARGGGGMSRHAHLDLDGLRLIAVDVLSPEQVDAALAAGGVR